MFRCPTSMLVTTQLHNDNSVFSMNRRSRTVNRPGSIPTIRVVSTRRKHGNHVRASKRAYLSPENPSPSFVAGFIDGAQTIEPTSWQRDCGRVYFIGIDIKGKTEIRPTKQLKWISGQRAALKSIGAVQSAPYSWLAKTDDCYVFTVEIDHKDKARNQFDRLEGIFRKEVLPVSEGRGDSPPRIRHAQELLDAVEDAYANGLKCQLLLEKGTKYGTTPGGVRAAVDGDSWIVMEQSGDVASGFQFVLERVR